MSKSVSKNYIYNLLMQILSVVFPVILTPYLSRILNADGVGVFNYTLSIVTIFTTFQTLGLNLFGQRETAYAQNNPKKLESVFSNLVLINIITSILSLVLFSLFSLTQNINTPIYLLWTLQIISMFFDIAWFYKGIEEFKSILIRNFIIKVLCLISVFIFVKSPNQVWIYVIIYSLSNLLGNITLWKNIGKYTRFSFKLIDKTILKKYWKNLFVFFIPQISTALYSLIDKSMLGTIIADKQEVGYYSQSQKIVGLLLTTMTSLSVVMLPRIASLITKKDTKKIKEYIEKSIQYTILTGLPIILGTILISDSFIPLFLGKGYDESVTTLILLIPIVGIIGISNITGMQILIPINKQKYFNISIIIGLIINVVLNLILIPPLRARGACIATIIAETNILVTQLIFTKDYINILSIIKKCKKYLISSIVMFIAGLLIRNMISNQKLQLVTVIVASIIIYLSILIILKDKLLFEIIRKVTKKGKQ